MRFTQDSRSELHIRGYAAGELRINHEVYRETVLITASTVASVPEISRTEDLERFDAQRIFKLEPELVLLGTGMRQLIPTAAWRSQFLQAQIGFEFMDTGAACRTFNVLVAEQRRVVALLIL